MANYYIDEDLTTGLNDGSTKENAFQSWSEAMTGIGNLSEDSTIFFYSTGVVSDNRQINISFVGHTLDIEFMDGAVAYKSTDFLGCFRSAGANDATSILNFKNPRLRADANAYGIRTLGGATVNIYNMEFIGTGAKRAVYNNSGAIINIDGMVATGSEFAIGNNNDGDVNAVNCYGNATVSAYSNGGTGALNLTTCASNDSTGSAGLQNVAYDTSTFTNVTAGSEDFTLVDGSPLIGVGTVTTSLTDINGTDWGIPRDIGTLAYTTSALTLDFSYNDINDGFAGFFNFVDDPNIRKFGKNALWLGIITGSSATLAVATGTTPYVVYVDGVQSIPTASAGRINLFSGLSDTAHTVCIISKTSAINNWNGISVNGTDTIQVTGSAPALVNTGLDYATDPTFKGISTFSTDVKDYADLTPAWNEVIKNNYEVGQIIVNATCDELYVYTDSPGLWLSIDGADPTEITATELNTESGQLVRRVVKVAEGLDNTTSHKYTIWSTHNDTFGIQGIVALVNGVAVELDAITPLRKTLMVGASVVNGTFGATAGEADTWEVGRRLDLAMTKAGADGTPVTQTILDMPDIITYNGLPDVCIFGSSTNDSGTSEELQADYEAFINYLITAGVGTIICRGVVPYFADRNTALENAVNAIGDSSVHFVSSETWDTIDTVDGTHPTALGYTQLSDYEVPPFELILNPVITYEITGVTYDNEGNITPSCQVTLFKHTGSGVYTYVNTQVSDGVTGSYDFSGLVDNDSSYMIYAHLDGAPNTFDCSDNNITPTEE